MNRKAVLPVVALGAVMVLAGCVSGLGGGGGGSAAPTAVIVGDEMVPGHDGFPEDAGPLVKPCVPLGTYAQGMQPAWHVWVIDQSTGERLTNQTVDSVTIELDSGRSIPTEFHTDDTSWHGCYVLPEDAETGEWGYTAIVEIDDETFELAGSFEVVERGEL